MIEEILPVFTDIKPICSICDQDPCCPCCHDLEPNELPMKD